MQIQDRGSLLELFGADQLNEIQERLSKITKLGFVTVNYQGEPMTDYTGFCSFCTHFRSHPELQKNCIASDAMSSIQAAISQKPLIYQCPCGLTEIAIPIVVNGAYLGGFLGGQALCSDVPANILQMKPATEPELFQKTMEEASADREMLPVFDYQHFMDIAELVNLVITLLCENKYRERHHENSLQRQLHRASFLDTQVHHFSVLLRGSDYGKILEAIPYFLAGMSPDSFDDYEDRAVFLRSFAQKLSQFALLDDADTWERLYPLQTKDVADLRRISLWMTRVLDYLYRQNLLRQAPVLESVFQYINQHVTEELTLSVLVEQCRISQSYLSRLFRNLFSLSVTDYIHIRKLLRAKQELLDSKKPISEIALEIGYNEYTYFSKIFKKYEGLSVQEYRKAPKAMIS